MNRSLFIAPHPDDETLFGAFTLMREKPLVVIVTDSYVQQNRGENITPQQRFQESVNAMKILGCPIVRLGIRDDIVNEFAVMEELAKFKNFEKVYAPALQGGNPCHYIVALASEKVFKRTPVNPLNKPSIEFIQYMTYSKEELYTTGSREIIPYVHELDLKNEALACYQSQIQLPATAPHFEAVKGRSEWYL